MDTFFALSDPTRRSIVEMLASQGQLTASAICRKFPVSPPAISQHLKVLREAQLVTMEKRAQQRIYAINHTGINEIEDWFTSMRRFWSDRFDALEELLETEQDKPLSPKPRRKPHASRKTKPR